MMSIWYLLWISCTRSARGRSSESSEALTLILKKHISIIRLRILMRSSGNSGTGGLDYPQGLILDIPCPEQLHS